MKKIVLLLCLLAVSIFFAQERNCSSMDNLAYRMQQDPELKQRMDAIEVFTRQRINDNQNNRVDGAVITIPVVVHVIYNNSSENISNAQIQSQIDVLNEDFRRTNSDANTIWQQAADTQIEFCLSKVDPNGNSSIGITRKASSRTSWGTNDAMKNSSQGGVDPWDTSQYLNIWVCNIGGGILGYAQFPGGSAATDGVVNSPQYFGRTGTATAPFNLGRTATHEVGHFLNLRHIWGDGGCGIDDFVSDTPESDASNGGCATTHVSCGSLDMVQNYMDYSNDSCMNLFTQGQKSRMRSVLDPGGSRRNLALSEKCGTVVTQPTCSDGVQNGTETGVDCGGTSCSPCQTACNDNELNIDIVFDNYPEETSWSIVNSSGATVASSNYSTANADGSSITEKLCLPNDCYTFTISDAYGDGMCCSYGNGSYNITDQNGTITSGGSFGANEATDFCLGNISNPSCDDGIQNGDETGIDCGGTACNPCVIPGTTILNEGYFESGWDGWIDGGGDSFRYNGNRSYENSYSIRLRDNSGTASSMTSPSLNLTGFNQVEVTFYFYSYSMETGEDFWLRYYNGSGWSTVRTWASGSSFQNNNFYSATVTLNSDSYNFANNSGFRFQCDASGNADQIYIDQVTIKGINGTRSERNNDLMFIKSLSDTKDLGDQVLYPNPVRGNKIFINNSYDLNPEYRIINLLGQTVKKGNMINGTINIGKLESGLYLIEFNDQEETTIKKFIKE
jgi:hypothetical protein